MSMSAVLIVSLAAGIILVIGGSLMMYMGNLVKNAYELKIQINADLDERLGKIAEDLDKKSRWIKRDLLAEIEKIKVVIEADSTRKYHDLAEPMLRRIEEMDRLMRSERDEWIKAFEGARQAIAEVDGKASALRRDVGRLETRMGLVSPPASAPAPVAEAAAAPAPEAPPSP
jgi:hypothetical protein